jgi:hypothetical protein
VRPIRLGSAPTYGPGGSASLTSLSSLPGRAPHISHPLSASAAHRAVCLVTDSRTPPVIPSDYPSTNFRAWRSARSSHDSVAALNPRRVHLGASTLGFASPTSFLCPRTHRYQETRERREISAKPSRLRDSATARTGFNSRSSSPGIWFLVLGPTSGIVWRCYFSSGASVAAIIPRRSTTLPLIRPASWLALSWSPPLV